MDYANIASQTYSAFVTQMTLKEEKSTVITKNLNYKFKYYTNYFFNFFISIILIKLYVMFKLGLSNIGVIYSDFCSI